MTTVPTVRRSILAAAVAAAIGLAACSAAANPSPPGSADPTGAIPSIAPPAGSNEPGAGPGGGGASGGGGTPGDPGSGVGVEPPGNPGPVGPGAGQPVLVRPLPGRANPHPVAPIALQASVDGRHVLVKISWYGGVAPCSVLDSVKVERSGTDIALTPIEGSSEPTGACIDLALLKATIVDLGELDPGTWRISSPGSEAPPIVITIA